MSRSGYSDDCDDQWSLIRWRGAVASAIRGARGQAFLREALAALDALPEPILIPNALKVEGGVCFLGAVGEARATTLEGFEREDDDDDFDQEGIARLFGIPHALACEIMWANDECGPYDETPRARWERMRRWVISNLKGDLPEASA